MLSPVPRGPATSAESGHPDAPVLPLFCVATLFAVAPLRAQLTADQLEVDCRSVCDWSRRRKASPCITPASRPPRRSLLAKTGTGQRTRESIRSVRYDSDFLRSVDEFFFPQRSGSRRAPTRSSALQSRKAREFRRNAGTSCSCRDLPQKRAFTRTGLQYVFRTGVKCTSDLATSSAMQQ
jgi:hypothetical protein